MSEHLVIAIRLHDTRYHGASEWPPAPARLFQALLSGVAQGKHIPEETQRGLRWLEQQPPPVVAAPYVCEGQRISSFVPNNDADSLGGDLSLIERIRAQKTIAPRIIASAEPLVYAWRLQESTSHLAAIEVASEKLYQFGRGVDMAWARAEVISEEVFANFLSTYRGTVHRPTSGAGANALACPMLGSLQSLVARYQATLERLRTDGEGRSMTSLFVQPPKPRFVQMSYDSPSPSRVFELVHAGTDKVYAWRLREVVRLVEQIRDAAAHRLSAALPRLVAEIHGSLIGKRRGETSAVSAEQRVRIVPLPSIGHKHADRAIRRVLVEVPHACPVSPDDVFWAFSGQVFDTATGELASFTLIPVQDDNMRLRYEGKSRRFRSITAVALPESAKRRRIDPVRQHDERKPASERIEEEQRAVAAIRAALRHAGVRARPLGISVQREPFEAKGARAEWFAAGTRFEKERLWHAEIEFAEALHGVLTIGDGRFLGLGLLAPQAERDGMELQASRAEQDGLAAFEIEGGLAPHVDPVELARALRRAVMSRVQTELGRGALPTFFSGHDANGDAAQSELEPHISLQYDPRGRLLIVAPHVMCRRRASRDERSHWARLESALQGFSELRAGRAGLLSLRPITLRPNDEELLASAREWVSLTPYTLERHPKKDTSPSQAIADEIRCRCAQLELPKPDVDVQHVSGLSGRGIQGTAQLTFAVPVTGPLILGRTRYLGGGLFVSRLR